MSERSLRELLPFEATAATPVGLAKDAVRRVLSWTAAPVGTLARVATREPLFALTFDDGPDPEETPPLLDLLARHGARATFFMVGARAAAHPELVARVAREGHAIANHSWDHASFPRLDRLARAEQLVRCEGALVPHATRLFRPPFGEQSLASLRDARDAGYVVVGWDVVAEDWRDDPAEALLARLLRRLRRGSIVALHDCLFVTEDARYRDRRPLRAALDSLLTRLGSSVRSVTVPELLRAGRPVWTHHYHRLPDEFHRRLLR